VLRDAGIEAVGGERLGAPHETKVTLLDDEVEVAALPADGAAAIRHADARRSAHFEAYGAAVAAAGVADF
jgi:hypothetical protein